ncbi:hypothetical protein J4404_00585 [Candidatus Woesearchaeota archaeon]|nr:hypothetical protein [Candidatus Woesearchaeota archaeon]
MSQNNGKETVKITYDPAIAQFMVLKRAYESEEGNVFFKFGRTYSPQGIKDKITELKLNGADIILDPYILPDIKSELEKCLQIKQNPLESTVSQLVQ